MADPRSVRATLNYSVDNGIPPDCYFYEPDPGVTLNPPGTDTRTVESQAGWSEAGKLSADREGFEIHPFEARFDPFDDEASIQGRFYAQVVAFVTRHAGASRVEVFDHTIRKRLPADLKAQTTVQRPAVLLVHSDYTARSGPQRVRHILPAEADRLLQGRVAFYNVWKPLYRRVEELPLAMCDARAHAPGDMLRMDLKYPERTGEISVMRWAPSHRWLYFPQMEAAQALLLKTCDSETDGRARFMGHTAFEDPTMPPDAPRPGSLALPRPGFGLPRSLRPRGRGHMAPMQRPRRSGAVLLDARVRSAARRSLRDLRQHLARMLRRRQPGDAREDDQGHHERQGDGGETVGAGGHIGSFGGWVALR